LVISCPCALVVSIPLGYFGGIGGASRRRVLVKGANYLDALNELHTLVFDKTGTLTRGVFEVTRIEPRGGYSAGQLLQLAAQAESGSTHPIALSIRKAFDGEVDADAVTELREEKGYGVFAVIGGRRVLAGSHRLMHRESIEHEDCDVIGTAVFVAVDDEYAGYLLVSDEVKPEAAQAISRLRRQGVKRIVMLTGDNARIAEAIAEELGIDEFPSELLPEDKVAIVEQLQNELDDGRKLAFTGDGINDAPVLMRADIGISMGGLGSDAAIEASDIVIMNDKVDRVAAVLDTARRTHAIVRQNIVFTLGAKLIFIALGAVGFVGMWAAVIGDVGVALLAVANATRTLRISRAEAAEN
ncbi:MAG: heavy metal translocating P-type ATPase, partial [Spirochaeta sp.]